MKSISWKTAWLGFFAASAGLLAGCGNNNGTGGTGGSTTTQSTGGGGTGATGGTGGMTTGGSGGSGGDTTGTTSSTVALKADGAPCMAGDECKGGFCLQQDKFGWPYGYCTGACNGLVACDPSSSCVALDQAGDQFCLENCKADADCGAMGRKCIDLMDMNGTMVCGPKCTKDDECKGYGLCDMMSGFCYVPEDCNKAGDEDGNGLADCEDPACAASCQTKIDMACMGAVAVNLTAAPVVKMGDTTGGSDIFAGTCAGSANSENIFKVTNGSAADGYVDLSLLSDQDLGVYARSDCAKDSELGCSDAVGGGTDPEVLDLEVAKGASVFVYVDGSTFGGGMNMGKYTLTATLIGTQAEKEPNNAGPNPGPTNANPVSIAALPTIVTADLNQMTDDDDWFLVDTTGMPGTKTITAETIGHGGDTCAGSGTGDIDTYIEIVAENGNILSPVDPNNPGSNEDIGLANYCSLATLDMAGPAKYYVHAKTSKLCMPMAGGPDCIFKYGIKINIQ